MKKTFLLSLISQLLILIPVNDSYSGEVPFPFFPMQVHSPYAAVIEEGELKITQDLHVSGHWKLRGALDLPARDTTLHFAKGSTLRLPESLLKQHAQSPSFKLDANLAAGTHLDLEDIQVTIKKGNLTAPLTLHQTQSTKRLTLTEGHSHAKLAIDSGEFTWDAGDSQLTAHLNDTQFTIPSLSLPISNSANTGHRLAINGDLRLTDANFNTAETRFIADYLTIRGLQASHHSNPDNTHLDITFSNADLAVPRAHINKQLQQRIKRDETDWKTLALDAEKHLLDVLDKNVSRFDLPSKKANQFKFHYKGSNLDNLTFNVTQGDLRFTYTPHYHIKLTAHVYNPLQFFPDLEVVEEYAQEIPLDDLTGLPIPDEIPGDIVSNLSFEQTVKIKKPVVDVPTKRTVDIETEDTEFTVEIPIAENPFGPDPKKDISFTVPLPKVKIISHKPTEKATEDRYTWFKVAEGEGDVNASCSLSVSLDEKPVALANMVFIIAEPRLRGFDIENFPGWLEKNMLRPRIRQFLASFRDEYVYRFQPFESGIHPVLDDLVLTSFNLDQDGKNIVFSLESKGDGS